MNIKIIIIIFFLSVNFLFSQENDIESSVEKQEIRNLKNISQNNKDTLKISKNNVEDKAIQQSPPTISTSFSYEKINTNIKEIYPMELIKIKGKDKGIYFFNPTFINTEDNHTKTYSLSYSNKNYSFSTNYMTSKNDILPTQNLSFDYNNILSRAQNNLAPKTKVEKSVENASFGFSYDKEISEDFKLTFSGELMFKIDHFSINNYKTQYIYPKNITEQVAYKSLNYDNRLLLIVPVEQKHLYFQNYQTFQDSISSNFSILGEYPFLIGSFSFGLSRTSIKQVSSTMGNVYETNFISNNHIEENTEQFDLLIKRIYSEPYESITPYFYESYKSFQQIDPTISYDINIPISITKIMNPQAKVYDMNFFSITLVPGSTTYSYMFGLSFSNNLRFSLGIHYQGSSEGIMRNYNTSINYSYNL